MSKSLIENPSVVPVRQVEISPAAEAIPPPASATVSPWTWLAVTCMLLSISGGIRFWRDWQFRGIAGESKVSPFPLSELPLVLGTWRAVEGSETHLDPETAKIAGSSDHIIRTYADASTGEMVSFLVVYGLANSIFAHAPEICYPAAGYQAVVKPVDHECSYPGSATPVRYRSAYFGKTVAGVTQYDEVLWSFWHAGSWLPEIASRWKLFRSSPAMFKIQIQYPAAKISSETSPGESLLKEIVRAIDIRLERVKAAGAKVSTRAQTPR